MLYFAQQQFQSLKGGAVVLQGSALPQDRRLPTTCQKAAFMLIWPML
jgi:hypothetical protein